MNITVDYYPINNKIYLVLKRVINNNEKFVLLANEMDNKDIMIKKEVSDGLEPITNQEELLNIINLLLQ